MAPATIDMADIATLAAAMRLLAGDILGAHALAPGNDGPRLSRDGKRGVDRHGEPPELIVRTWVQSLPSPNWRGPVPPFAAREGGGAGITH